MTEQVCGAIAIDARRRRQRQRQRCTNNSMAWSSTVMLLLALTYHVATAFVAPSITRHAFVATARTTTSPRRTTPLMRLHHDNHDERRRLEFVNLEPLPENKSRQQRLQQDQITRQQFVPFGDNLWALRQKIHDLSRQLLHDMQRDMSYSSAKHDGLRHELRHLEAQDPELTYALELTRFEEAARTGRTADAAIYRQRARQARSCLPQFNLDGLWVGKYGSHGYEMVNVTYVGDTLIATKVTGDKNVPRGEITFQANLHPLAYTDNGAAAPSHLAPIQLTDKAARKWGTAQLPRYTGLGQVAEEGFANHQWMDGQLIIIGDTYFSFAWLPVEQQIFFGRPSPELALKMLRDCGGADLRTTSSRRRFVQPPSLDDCIEVQKEFVTRCLEQTMEVQDELFAGIDDGNAGARSFGCIWDSADSDECYFE